MPARPVGYPPFTVPSSVANPPMIWQVWRDMPGIAREPATTPGGEPVRMLGVLGPSLLMGDRDNFYAWSRWDERFRPLVAGTGVDATAHPDRVVVAPMSIVWLADRGDGLAVYRAPRVGGSMQLVTVVRQPGADVRNLFATEDHAYWSTRDGVLRVSLSDGSAGLLAGYEDLVTDGTAWASGSGVYKHLVTGEERRIRAAPEADAARLRCIPAFCVAPPRDGGEVWLLQRPDGSRVTRLPIPGPPVAIGAIPGSGLIVLADGVLLDPVSGAYGFPGLKVGDACPLRSEATKEYFAYRYGERTAGGCGNPGVTFIATGN